MDGQVGGHYLSSSGDLLSCGLALRHLISEAFFGLGRSGWHHISHISRSGGIKVSLVLTPATRSEGKGMEWNGDLDRVIDIDRLHVE